MIRLSREKQALVDDDDFDRLVGYNWFLGNNGYAVRNARSENGKKTQIYMHRVILGTPEEKKTDHINENKLDNRKVNLRACTVSENHWNKGAHKDSKSGLKGVFFHKRTGKWEAQIMALGKRYHLGYFFEKERAAVEYNNAAIKLHGEFAKLNVV